MEAEFREIDESGSWNAIYQVGPLDTSRWKLKLRMGEESTRNVKKVLICTVERLSSVLACVPPQPKWLMCLFGTLNKRHHIPVLHCDTRCSSSYTSFTSACQLLCTSSRTAELPPPPFFFFCNQMPLELELETNRLKFISIAALQTVRGPLFKLTFEEWSTLTWAQEAKRMWSDNMNIDAMW